jgi:N-acetyl-gamma-glutamyl-phosphate reductase
MVIKMSKPKVYIDGQEGTTGVQIDQRLSARADIQLLRIDPDKRKDTDQRRKLLSAADLVFLCLPDEAAIQAVGLIENPDTRVIDASTAHRVNPAWVYGFAELFPGQREKIAAAKRVANPGCHATGFLATVAPLVARGVLGADYPLGCYSLTGSSGGGKKMIAEYEAPDRSPWLDAPNVYALTLQHKHLPEMQRLAGLTHPPAFAPILGDIYKGMATGVLLHNHLLKGGPGAKDIHQALCSYYAAQPLVKVNPFGGVAPRIATNALAGRDTLEITVSGNEAQTMLTAQFDNLGKGASGAAVQNMNLMLGFEETAGLAR